MKSARSTHMLRTMKEMLCVEIPSDGADISRRRSKAFRQIRSSTRSRASKLKVRFKLGYICQCSAMVVD